jgi:hypothetical protein
MGYAVVSKEKKERDMRMKEEKTTTPQPSYDYMLDFCA